MMRVLQSKVDHHDLATEPKASYADLCKPELASFLGLLKMDVVYHRAYGNSLFTYRDGAEVAILDLVGGYGSTILGHNNAGLKDVIKRNLDSNVPMHAQGSIRAQAARLAEKINAMLRESFAKFAPPDYIMHLANTGTEATEGALKHALMAWQQRRDQAIFQAARRRSVLRTRQLKNADQDDAVLVTQIARIDAAISTLKGLKPTVAAMRGSFHGKTAGALAVTNPAYGKMYETAPINRIFLTPDMDQTQLEALFRTYSLDLGDGIVLSTLAGVIIEVIQGEGGIKPLPKAFVTLLAAQCQAHFVPLIVDEVQTGMYRTGAAFASQHYDILPDYLTLGKSLGGGLVKIAAVLIRRDLYVSEFSMTHTSTFSEDDHASLVALHTLESVRTLPVPVSAMARDFEDQVIGGLTSLARRYPGVIKEVRGQGFLIGIEFAASFAGRAAIFVDTLVKSGQYVYLLASYLLNRHDIRVAATLNESNTLRIEPALTINRQDGKRLLDALETMVKLIADGRFLALSAHIWMDEPGYRDSPVSSFIAKQTWDVTPETRRVDFLTHTIDATTLKSIDPLFMQLTDRDIAHYLDSIAPTQAGAKYYEQLIHGKNGASVLLSLRGVPACSRFFEQSLRSGSSAAYAKTRQMALDAVAGGAKHIGLGQFTSIVTSNGLDLEDVGVAMTTGNSFTVGSSYLAVLRALASQGHDAAAAGPKDLKIGLVGAAGNIGSVLGQLLADIASELTLIHRENIGKSPKFQAVVSDIAKHSALPREAIKTASDPAALQGCDVIVLSINGTEAILKSEHLKPGAIVLDVSVPSVISAEALARDDVTFLFGGHIRMPLGQTLDHPSFAHIGGEIYACLAETITTSLLDLPGSFSLGSLTKAQVLASIAMATEVGMELGGGRDRYVKKR